MTSIPRDTKEDVLVALVDRNDAWPEEGVVKSRDEEERLLDQVEFVTNVTGLCEVLQAREARLSIRDLIYLRHSEKLTVLFSKVAAWVCFLLQVVILLELISKQALETEAQKVVVKSADTLPDEVRAELAVKHATDTHLCVQSVVGAHFYGVLAQNACTEREANPHHPSDLPSLLVAAVLSVNVLNGVVQGFIIRGMIHKRRLQKSV